MESILNYLKIIGLIVALGILITTIPKKKFDVQWIKILAFSFASIALLITIVTYILSSTVNERKDEEIRFLAGPPKITVQKVVKGKYNKYHGYNYSILFTTSKNEPLNEIILKLEILNGATAIFTGYSGYGTYSYRKILISEDKKLLKYNLSMTPGRNPVIGFFVSQPTNIRISGNYSLETQTISLE